MHRHVRRSLLTFPLVATLTGLAPLALPAADAGSPGTWTKLSSGSLQNIDIPTVHRYGTQLQVFWSESGSGDRLRTRLIAANGTVASANLGVFSSWQAVTNNVGLISASGKRVLVFSSLRGASPSDPYNAGAMYFATSTDGKAWTLGSGSLSADTHAYATSGMGAVNDSGHIAAAYVAGSDDQVTLHRDVSPDIPASSPDQHTASAGNFTYNVNLGKDLKTGKVWTVWYSNSGVAGKEGVNAQAIYPTAGSRVHAPSSSVNYAGHPSSISPSIGQSLSAISRPSSRGGGVFTAYSVGYPTPHRIAVWRLGASSPAFVINVGYQVKQIGVGAGPGGRLWIYWADQNTQRIHATRTNPAATRIGVIRSVNAPGGNSNTVWHLDGDGANGRLDLVAVSGSSDIQVFHTQVLPGLHGNVSPGTVSPGDSITVKVDDAGVAVVGATVHYAGKTKTTNSSGRATFTVPHSSSSGAKTVTFSKGSYASGSARFHVS